MYRKLTAAAILLAVTVIAPPPGVASAPGIVPPSPGVAIPQAFLDRLQGEKPGPALQNAWIQKAERVRRERNAYVADRGFYNRGMLSSEQLRSMAVSGTLEVPVLCSKFADTGADPFAISTIQNKLFNPASGAPYSVTGVYEEMSYGDINLTGTVYGWYTLSQNESFYEGGCQAIVSCISAGFDDYLLNTLSFFDPTVDFAQYDNDGPDGVPNSGDDDGFVDFVAFVHPERGGECGAAHIWSHRWNLSSLTGGSVFTTNDARNGGGFIRVNDYVIQPAKNCDNTTLIDVGVFCHEFGHAFGIPDFYDINGGSQGIGEWGLMGSGNWNSTTSPSHMTAWTKYDLGWSNIMEVSGVPTPYTLSNVEFNRTVYRANVMDERWRRMSACAIAGSWSMRCGLTTAEGNARSWVSGDGYGDMWRESMSREFTYDGGSTITLQFDYSVRTEANFDYLYVRIDVGGTVSNLAFYTGVTSGSANLNLAPALVGSGVSSYTISFDFESDTAWSDRDGQFVTSCGPAVIDNISLNGGGESYFNDFETREEGWHADMSDPAEFFFVENRQPVGSDVNLHGGGGLAIWHVNRDIIRTGQAGNTGGSSGLLPHGLDLEQADGLDQLGAGTNRGDSNDPFPGGTANTAFTNATTPSSLGERAAPNNVTVNAISLNPANGGDMTATMSGGWSAPTYTSHNPGSADANQMVTVSVSGGNIAYGATVDLVSTATIPAASVNWRGKDLLEADFDLTGATPGVYDVVISNPGGASVTDVGGFTVNPSTPVGLQSFVAFRTSVAVELNWVTAPDVLVTGWHVDRATDGSGFQRLTTTQLDGADRAFVDAQAATTSDLTYRLVWVTNEGEALAAQTTVRAGQAQFALSQNYPNPFNPATAIPFEIGETAPTTLRIYNTRGQVVRTLVNQTLTPKTYQITWDGRNDAGLKVGSGVYFYKLEAGRFQDVRKMVLLQ